MLFKLTNKNSDRMTHCGVLEFVADEGICYLPHWVSWVSGESGPALGESYPQIRVKEGIQNTVPRAGVGRFFGGCLFGSLDTAASHAIHL